MLLQLLRILASVLGHQSLQLSEALHVQTQRWYPYVQGIQAKETI